MTNYYSFYLCDVTSNLYYHIVDRVVSPTRMLYFSSDNSYSVGECLWLDLRLIHCVLEMCKKLFPVATYASTSIPTYPSGQIGFVLAAKSIVSYVHTIH